MSTSLRLGIAEFRARPGRALLPGVALVVGVACLLAALVLSDSLRESAGEGAPTVPSTVDHVVRLEPGGDRALDDALLSRLAKEGETVPVRQVHADLLDANGRASKNQASVDVEVPGLARIPLAEGRSPAADGEVVVDRLTAYTRGLKVGDHLKFADVAGKPLDVVVSGIAKRGGLDSRPTLSAGPDLARKLDATPETEAIWVIGGSRESVAAAAGDGYLVGNPRSDTNVGGDLTYVLLPFSILALATSVFVASATFRAVYAQRQRQTALLRCLGAHRGPLVRRSLVEALFTGAFAGVVGALVGGPTAWLLARVFDLTGVSALFGAVQLSPALLPSLPYVVLGVVVAAALSVLAAVRPALGASRVSPLAALRTSDNQVPSRSVRRLRFVFGVLLTGCAGLLALGALAAKGTSSVFIVITFSGIFAVAGLFWVLGPVTVPLVGRLFGRFGGAHWKLASAEVRRMPQRSASVALPLLLASAMVTFFVVITGAAQDMAADFGDERRPDATVADTGNRPLPAIPNVDGVAASVLVHTGDSASGVDPERMKAWLRAQNFGATGLDEFGPGTALVPEYMDEPVVVNGKSYRVVGSAPAEVLGYRPVVADTSVGTPRELWVALKPGADPAAYQAAVQRELNGSPTVLVTTAAAEKAEIDRYLRLATVLMMVLLGLSVAVAVTGIGTALTISVQERRKELALRRALGVTRGGLLGGVIAEAVLLSLVGVLGGGALGFGYALLTLEATDAFKSIMPGPSVLVPLLVGGVIVVALAVVSAFGPSRSAARIRPAAGLASG